MACFLLIVVNSLQAAQNSGRVVKVIDGDSLIIAAKNQELEVRLYGIDCPEFGQPFSRKAINFVKQRLRGREVQVDSYYRDRYGRLVAVVSEGEKTINGLLVEEGLAWVYPYFCKKNICQSWKIFQRRAKLKKKGLWKMDQPIPPWQWKKLKKMKQAKQ